MYVPGLFIVCVCVFAFDMENQKYIVDTLLLCTHAHTSTLNNNGNNINSCVRIMHNTQTLEVQNIRAFDIADAQGRALLEKSSNGWSLATCRIASSVDHEKSLIY